MRQLWMTLLVAVLLALPHPAQAQEISTLADTPLGMLQSYYDAINRGDYNEAYIYLNFEQSFYDFVGGFEDTTFVEPYFGTYRADGTGFGHVPAVLIGYQRNGGAVTFAGCMYLSAGAAAGQTVWRIDRTTLQEAPVLRPSHASIRAYVTAPDCASAPLPSQPAPADTEAEFVLRQYFDTIQNDDFLIAYSAWLYPLPFQQPNGAPATDYRTPFPQFTGGYANTLSITLYTGAYQFGGAAAGKPYLDGYQPVVLLGHDRITENTITAFSGCYLMGRFTDGRMGIVNARINVLQNGVPTGDTIIDALTIDCTTLGIAQ